MSHELRTPLNSLLILSDQLSKNSEGNLSPRQMEYAKTIHSSGNDLLNLINDILDLSKIESGTVVVDISDLRFDDLHGFVERTFNHVAESKNLDFEVSRSADLPKAIQTDAKRLQQILKNLLSNSFKFTRRGGVRLDIGVASPGVRERDAARRPLGDLLLGHRHRHRHPVREAADHLRSLPAGRRQHQPQVRGTGLGLAISRELSTLLGGEIRLTSAPGEGSVFTLFLPVSLTPSAAAAATRRPALVSEMRFTSLPSAGAVAAAPAEPGPLEDEAGDDRAQIAAGDRVLLIVENDFAFARMLSDAAHEHGYKVLITGFGSAALGLVRQYAPSAITLDISLPDISGWRVLERLKHTLSTRHIPVHVITTDDDRDRGLQTGAIGVATKPIQNRETLDEVLDALRMHEQRAERELLLVEPDPERRAKLRAFVPAAGVTLHETATAAEALRVMESRPIDCVVVNPRLPDMPVPELVERLVGTNGHGDVPVLIHGAEALAEPESAALKRLGQNAVVKEVHGIERVLDWTSLFLHRKLDDLPPAQRQVIHDLHDSDKVLSGRKVLIVDDDIRNIFALTSILEQHQMTVAARGERQEAIAIVESTPDIDVVLMDVMMPEMDGLDTTRAIRRIHRLRDLPIIAVTAKAMKGDRERCIEAGAWDYLAKPVDPDELIAMLRSWLMR